MNFIDFLKVENGAKESYLRDVKKKANLRIIKVANVTCLKKHNGKDYKGPVYVAFYRDGLLTLKSLASHPKGECYRLHCEESSFPVYLDKSVEAYKELLELTQL